MNDNCVFCKIIEGSIQAEVVHTTPYVTIIKDKNPVTTTHLVAISKRHYDNLDEMMNRSQVSLEAATFLLSGVVQYATEHLPDGYRLIINTGENAGQTVKHAHVHILGGTKLPGLLGE